MDFLSNSFIYKVYIQLQWEPPNCGIGKQLLDSILNYLK